MAVYKIFPEKDTFILTKYPAQNTGRDEVLEISNVNTININTSAQGDLPSVKRSLIQFKTTDINNIVNNKISGSAFQSNLKLYLANATISPLDYIIYAYPISGSWNMGTGREADILKTEDGCSWTWRGASGSFAWTISGFSDFATASYSGSTTGGGTWYTGSSTLNPVSSQSFNYTSTKDISIDVTNTIKLWNSESIDNNGFILKLDDSVEFSDTYVDTRYFSVDTHTIYPPALEFKWDDSIYSTTLTQVTSSDFILAFTNLKQEFEDSGIYNFKVKARDTYPTRAFQTSSVYLNTKALPTSSYWGLKDAKTGEIVVDFDTTYTKISADNSGNYFKVYMDGLEPERYYQLLIKIVVGSETLIIEDKGNYFKIVR
jgi:hypothetical protein